MNRIKMLREAKGLGLRELAADLERHGTPLSWMTINKCERADSNPSWKSIRILSDSLPPELQLAVEKFYREQKLKYEENDGTGKE